MNRATIKKFLSTWDANEHIHVPGDNLTVLLLNSPYFSKTSKVCIEFSFGLGTFFFFFCKTNSSYAVCEKKKKNKKKKKLQV